MKKSVFLVYCLLIAGFYSQTYSYFRYKFSGVEQLRVRVGQLERQAEQEKFRAEIASYQLSEYKAEVATLIPEALRKTNDVDGKYQLRNLASVVQSPMGERIKIERASGLFEKAKEQFRGGLYDDSTRGFQDVIDRYPQSVHAVEAHFLLAESQFQIKEYEACLRTVEAMITLFPDSELTGFALLRLGKIYEYQDRLEDAVEVYRTVLGSYQDQPLRTQARLSLKAVEL